jgi:hypothetical protein
LEQKKTIKCVNCGEDIPIDFVPQQCDEDRIMGFSEDGRHFSCDTSHKLRIEENIPISEANGTESTLKPENEKKLQKKSIKSKSLDCAEPDEQIFD